MTIAVTTDVRTVVPDVEVAEPLLHILDDPQAVDAWLASLGPNEEVGVTEIPDACPLASYLAAANGEDEGCTLVYGSSYEVHGHEYIAEPWAARFVSLVDREEVPVVRAGRAREILAHVLDPRVPLPPCSYEEEEVEEPVCGIAGCSVCAAKRREVRS